MGVVGLLLVVLVVVVVAHAAVEPVVVLVDAVGQLVASLVGAVGLAEPPVAGGLGLVAVDLAVLFELQSGFELVETVVKTVVAVQLNRADVYLPLKFEWLLAQTDFVLHQEQFAVGSFAILH